MYGPSSVHLTIVGPGAKTTDPVKRSMLPGDAMPYIAAIAKSGEYHERIRREKEKYELRRERET